MEDGSNPPPPPSTEAAAEGDSVEDQTLSGPPTRFEIELDFVQSLANPHYVNFLAQNGYLEDERFINYLDYLEYWRQPSYATYIVYPNCLHMLTLLKQERFRQDIKHMDMAQMLMDDMFAKWLGMGRYKPPETPTPPELVDQQNEGVRGNNNLNQEQVKDAVDAAAANGHGNGEAMDGIQTNTAVKMEQ
ncbi:mediator of RNA polymerase II transcription subunit 31 [Myxozyma melibiosi]|uniref:Mediator of RNA polymerase II transcription subunit 31 n=1 Tax=Myxozyma melibiosi TaxID=54550 RepID=A0ABR1F6S6_9ASCO